ncbi:copper homeostasis periplasmic binding protein CopC [Candidimonas humi]|uniref:Copper homeostasis periplasmic binding protein CopC n=1 Tax=Candidimonas humi TaxID=683355 RepID=A0ABV8P4K3_9BURK|nr:copper homeostasis periplasmic binding protein CopC [Candidimonas humi]MBV6307239.1 copper homeostasis periplasmic binding protein CopC [Candidimonas humi]
MSSPRFPSRLVAACVLPLAMLAAPAAFAHAHLKSQVPAADSVAAAAPKTIELHFSEGVEPAFTGISMQGPGAAVKLGKPAVDAHDKAVLRVPVQGAMPAGRYVVNWHAVAVDGHKTKGQYSFSVK